MQKNQRICYELYAYILTIYLEGIQRNLQETLYRKYRKRILARMENADNFRRICRQPISAQLLPISGGWTQIIIARYQRTMKVKSSGLH